MCQLLGINCAAPTDTTFSFTGFAARGGITDHHADGWGIAFFEDRACRLFIDHQPASTSAVAEFVKRYPIKSKISSRTFARPQRAWSGLRTAIHLCASAGGVTGFLRITAMAVLKPDHALCGL